MALALRLRGLEITCLSLPRAPYLNSDLIEELGGTYVSSQDTTLAEVSEERGPFDLIMDATGFSPIIWEAAEVLGKNGVLVLSSITGGDRRVEIASDRINQSFVLGNKVMVGTVNASPADFESGVTDLIRAEALHPGWLGKLLTTLRDPLARRVAQREKCQGDAEGENADDGHRSRKPPEMGAF